jgi:hypothetical protein
MALLSVVMHAQPYSSKERKKRHEREAHSKGCPNGVDVSVLLVPLTEDVESFQLHHTFKHPKGL